MINKIRDSKFVKVIAICLVFLLTINIFELSSVFALTNGPSQPEFSGFSQVGNSDMVDPFTGNFSYNIPLFEIGGFPVNLTYNSSISMDQEAGWVGLGWSLNTGAIVRNLRGLPDDFSGDLVEVEISFSLTTLLRFSLTTPTRFSLTSKNRFCLTS